MVSRFSEEFEQYLHHVLLDPPPLEEEPEAGETASRPQLPARGEKETAIARRRSAGRTSKKRMARKARSA